MTTPNDLLDLLQARHGIVCAVGAGGKKTTLYRLLQAHPGRAAFASTVFTYMFPEDLAAFTVVDTPERIADVALEASHKHPKVAFASPSDKPGRLRGMAPEAVKAWYERSGVDAIYVKADGARMRVIKAPDEREPNLIVGADTVLALVSARSVGLPLSERCAHRPQCVANVTGARIGETLTPEHLARLMASPEGLLRAVGDAVVVPVINMAESASERAAAHAAASMALALTDRFDYVVVAAMRAPEPIVEVVRRS